MNWYCNLMSQMFVPWLNALDSNQSFSGLYASDDQNIALCSFLLNILSLIKRQYKMWVFQGYLSKYFGIFYKLPHELKPLQGCKQIMFLIICKDPQILYLINIHHSRLGYDLNPLNGPDPDRNIAQLMCFRISCCDINRCGVATDMVEGHDTLAQTVTGVWGDSLYWNYLGGAGCPLETAAQGGY